MESLIASINAFHLLLTSIVLSEASILRNNCRFYGDFNRVEQNVVLHGSVIEALLFFDRLECIETCIKNYDCRSVNYEIEGENTCELNAKTVSNSNMSTLITKIGWEFISSEYGSQNVGEVCNKMYPCSRDEICFDICSCPGYQCEKCGSTDFETYSASFHFQDCDFLKKAGATKNGIYSLKISNPCLKKEFKAYCDLENQDHGWTVIQRRVDGKTDFDRPWKDYKQGFGNLSTSFWLGLDNMHALTRENRSMVRIELGLADNKTGVAEYFHFVVGDEFSSYTLQIGEFNHMGSTLRDSMRDMTEKGGLQHNQIKFSTKDRENDREPLFNCAEKFHGGWWFSQCYLVYLNGLYWDPSIEINCQKTMTSGKYMTWFKSGHCFGGITFSEMKIRKI